MTFTCIITLLSDAQPSMDVHHNLKIRHYCKVAGNIQPSYHCKDAEMDGTPKYTEVSFFLNIAPLSNLKNLELGDFERMSAHWMPVEE